MREAGVRKVEVASRCIRCPAVSCEVLERTFRQRPVAKTLSEVESLALLGDLETLGSSRRSEQNTDDGQVVQGAAQTEGQAAGTGEEGARERGGEGDGTEAGQAEDGAGGDGTEKGESEDLLRERAQRPKNS